MSGKNSRIKLVRNFFLIYFIVITAVLLWKLAHCGEDGWAYRDLFLTEQEDGQDEPESVILLDGKELVLKTAAQEEPEVGKDARLCGVVLLRYENENGLRFYDETLRAQVFSGEGRKELGSAALPLATQSPYIQDETKIFIPFKEAIGQTAREPLEIRVFSEGLLRNGLRVFAAKESGTGAPVVGRACYVKRTYRFFGPIVFFLFEAALGLYCMLLCLQRRLPVFGKRRGVLSAPAGRGEAFALKEGVRTESTREAAPSGRTRKEAAAADPPAGRNLLPGKVTAVSFAVPALVLAVLLAVAGYAYFSAVSPAADACGAEYLVSGSILRDSLSLSQGESARQEIMPRQDGLSGIGIRIRGKEDGEPDMAALQDARLSWRIYDEKESLLAEGGARVGDLKTVDTVLLETTAEKEVLKASSNYLLLPLDGSLEETAGTRLILELGVEDAGGETGQAVPFQTSTGGNGRVLAGGERKDEELCLLGVYRNNGFLKGFFLRVLLAAAALVLLLYFLIFFLNPGVPLTAFACVMGMGLIFSFMTPAYTVPDERTHIETVYALSNRFLGINQCAGPERLMKRACDVDASILNSMPLSADSYRRQTKLFGAARDEALFHTRGEAAPVPGTELVSVYARNALGNAASLCYLPAAIGFTAARLLGRNLITMIMAARWCNLLVCALLLSLAAGRLPSGGASLAVIGLFPRTLQLMASCSYDGMIMAGIFVFIAWCCHFAQEDGYSACDVFVLACSGVFTALCKGGAYLPVTGILLLIPLMKKEGGARARREWTKASLAMLASAGVLFLVKNASTILGIFSRASGEVTFWTGEETLYTLSDLLTDPGHFVKLVLNTIYFRSDSLIGEMVGYTLFKQWYIVYGFLFLLLLGLAAKKEGNEEIRRFLPRWKLFALLCAAASAALIGLSMLLSFTASDAMYIGGIQGRYFLPLLPLVFPALENRLIAGEKIRTGRLLYAAGVLAAFSVFQVFLGCFSLI